MYLYLSLVEKKVTEFYHYIDRRRYLVWLKWLIFIAFPAQFMVSLRKHFAHHSQYGPPTPTCSWNPGNLDASRYVHVSWRTCLHSTHPRFRAFIIQWNSPCWLQGSWFSEKLSNTRRAKTTESLKLWWQASISTASSRRWVDKIYPARELLES